VGGETAVPEENLESGMPVAVVTWSTHMKEVQDVDFWYLVKYQYLPRPLEPDPVGK
jgi:hypothetical protein